MRSLNGSIHTTQTPPPLSFYNTFKSALKIYVGLSERQKKDELMRNFRKISTTILPKVKIKGA
jgi:hypothetical protein